MDGFPVPINWFSSFRWSAFFLAARCMPFAYDLQNHQLKQTKSKHQSAVQCPPFHFNSLTSSVIQSFPLLTCNNLWPVLFLVFQVSWVQYLCRALAQYAAVVCYQHWCDHTANWVNMVTYHSLSSKCRSCHVQCCQPPSLCSLKNHTIPLPVHVTKGIAA